MTAELYVCQCDALPSEVKVETCAEYVLPRSIEMMMVSSNLNDLRSLTMIIRRSLVGQSNDLRLVGERS